MGWMPGPWATLRPLPPPPLRATFNGNLEKLAFFLNQVQTHLDWHGKEHADNDAQVDTVMANLEGEAVEWVTAVHDKGAPELVNSDMFLGELRDRFSDIMQAQRAEAEV